MALIRTGGSNFKKVELWTNSAPSSNFAAQTISDVDVSTYDAIEVGYKASTTSSETASAIYYIDELEKAFDSFPKPRFTLAARDVSSFLARTISVSSNNVVFGSGEVGATDSGHDNYIIPLTISGINF